MLIRRSKLIHDEGWGMQNKAPAPPRYRSGVARIKHLMVILILIAVAVEILGMPHVRLHTESGNGIYWSVTGKQTIPITSPDGRPPVLRMIKLEPSPIDYAGQGVKWAWSRIQQQALRH